jgi:plastocyanin
MNTRKQVLVMTALLLLMLVAIAIYGAWYPNRAEDAEAHFEEATAERGAILFARNCRLCHGDVGEGGSLGGRLPAAPPLNRADLKGFADSNATLSGQLNTRNVTFEVSDGSKFEGGQTIIIDEERMKVRGVDGQTLTVQRGTGHTAPAAHFPGATISIFDEADLEDTEELITNTITCGRVGTAMPPWAQEQGGPLSEEQIRQLMVLITTGRWELVAEENDVEDTVAASLTAPVAGDATTMGVSDVTVFTADQALRLGEERLRVTSVPTPPRNERGQLPADKSGELQIERGILGTTPLDHPQETPIFLFPEVSDPSINEESCGQMARAPAPSGPPGLIEPFTGQTVEISAQNVQFNTRELRVNTGGQVRVRFNNMEAVDHNVAVYQSSTGSVPVSPGSVGVTFQGPNVDDTVFDVPAAGSYFFRCDVHPTLMTGNFIVQ